MRILRLVAFFALGVFTSAACGQMQSAYYECPSGYVCKVLTPSGFDKELHRAGQVNLGGVGTSNNQNFLVRIEATTLQMKEQFLPPDVMPDKQDHRLTTKNGT